MRFLKNPVSAKPWPSEASASLVGLADTNAEDDPNRGMPTAPSPMVIEWLDPKLPDGPGGVSGVTEASSHGLGEEVVEHLAGLGLSWWNLRLFKHLAWVLVHFRRGGPTPGAGQAFQPGLRSRRNANACLPRPQSVHR
jgi:hypothetical protein